MREFRVEFLKECITRMSDGTMLAIVNEFNDAVGNNRIYLNDEDGIEELCSGLTYDEVIRAVSYGEYSYTDKFIWFNDYRNICSSDDILGVSFCEIAEWMIDNWSGEASHAWVIFNASSGVENGEIYDDLIDELKFRFNEKDMDSLAEWVEVESVMLTDFSYWVRKSWDDLKEEYKIWLEEKENEYEKTLKRCGLD
jgi:hypothetical protein